MGLLIDTHYHMHAAHRTGTALRDLLANLVALRTASGDEGDDLAAVLVACGTDDPFETLFARRETAAAEGIEITRTRSGTFSVSDEEGTTATLFPGRQFLSRERIEAIAIGETPPLDSPGALADVIDAIERAGALPVLPWSPGRWAGKRGRIVRATLETRREGSVLLGEIALRPTFARNTLVHRWADEHGLPFLWGTDPLPSRADETIGGQLATRFAALDAAGFTPAAALAEALRGGAACAGARNGLFEASCRYLRHFGGRLTGT